MKAQKLIANAPDPQARADNFARRVAARLDSAALELDHDLAQRLRVARERAVAQMQVQTTPVTSRQGHSAALSLTGFDARGGWGKWLSFLPFLTLIVGLVCIDAVQDQYRAEELADVDVELLTDELPPAAYTDPGFVEFLRTTPRN
jgi:hypothetical protein